MNASMWFPSDGLKPNLAIADTFDNLTKHARLSSTDPSPAFYPATSSMSVSWMRSC